MAEQQTVITRDAPEIEAYKLGLMKLAKQLTGAEPRGGLPSYQVTAIDPLQQMAFSQAPKRAFAFADFMDPLQRDVQKLRPEAITDLTRTGLTNIGAGFNPAVGVGSFFNPFEQQVVDRTLADLRRQSDIAGQRDRATAVDRGAFGGSRDAILQAERERNLLDKQADVASKLRMTGYQDASTRAQKAYENAMRRRLAGVQLGMKGEQAAIDSALKGIQLRTGIGELGQQMQLKGLQSLTDLGTARRNIDQQRLDAQRQTGLQDVYEPYQRLGFYSDILRGVPTSQQTLTTSTAPQPTLLSQLVGAAGTGLGLYGAAKGSNII